MHHGYSTGAQLHFATDRLRGPYTVDQERDVAQKYVNDIRGIRLDPIPDVQANADPTVPAATCGQRCHND